MHPNPYRSIQRVYFDDLDALGLLHNVRFLLFAERARGEWLTGLGFRLLDAAHVNPDNSHVVAEHKVVYLEPVRNEQDVLIELLPTHLGRTSLVVSARVSSRTGGIVHAVMNTRIVRVDAVTYRPCPWTDHFRKVIEPLVTEPRAFFGEHTDRVLASARA